MKHQTIEFGFLFCSALLLLASSCKQDKAESFSLKGQIKGIDSGTVVLLFNNEVERTTKAIDSVTFKNGEFEMKGKIEYPEMMTIVVKPGNWITNVFVENGTMVLKSDTANAEHYDYTQYGGSKGANLKTVSITGSKNQDIYSSFEKDPQQLQYKKIFAEIGEQYNTERSPEINEKIRFQVDSVGKLRNAWQLRWIDKSINQYPDLTAGVYLLSNYYSLNLTMPLPEIESLLAKIDGEGKKSIYYQNLLKSINRRKAVLVGKQAPDFTVLKKDSTSLKLSSLGGKYVMLDFWASWCKPCRAAIPHWRQVYQKYHAKGFEIVSITNDIKRADWLKALDQEKMPWIQVTDEFPIKNRPARVMTEYEAPFLPFYILLDKGGKILVRSGDEKDIDQKLKELL